MNLNIKSNIGKTGIKTKGTGVEIKVIEKEVHQSLNQVKLSPQVIFHTELLMFLTTELILSNSFIKKFTEFFRFKDCLIFVHF